MGNTLATTLAITALLASKRTVEEAKSLLMQERILKLITFPFCQVLSYCGAVSTLRPKVLTASFV